MKVYKRNGEEQDFCLDKIKNAINKANNSVEESERMDEEALLKVVNTVQTMLKSFTTVNVEDIQDLVEKALMKHNKYSIAKNYILYRDEKKKNKKFNSIEEQAISLVEGTNESLRGDNANKHIDVASSQRDYLAGLVCKSYFKKTAPKRVVEAHNKKLIHFHDADYSPLMPLFNCCLINLEDMLQNGFQMGDTHIDSPKTFSIACNLAAQVNLIVSGSQYGGQTISWAHLVPFVQKTREYYSAIYDSKVKELKIPKFFADIFKDRIIEILTEININTGIKTYQYQVICHQSSNGQTPFVSNNLCLREVSKELQPDFAKIIEKVFKRRIKGVKDSQGSWTSPLFPKLLYWLCEGLNVKESDPYYYLTKLAAKCNTIRCQPDINSEKKSREIKKGQIIPSMGCRSWLAPAWEEESYPRETKFHWQFIEDGNKKYKDAPKANFDYSGKIFYCNLPTTLAEAVFDKIVIDFDGNSGWPLRVEGDKVIVLKPKVYGRFNSGVVTVNIPHAALTAVEEYKKKSEEVGAEAEKPDLMKIFYDTLDDYLGICRQGLVYRTDRVKKIKAKNIPIHFMYGAMDRMDENDLVEKWIEKHPKLMSTSFGFVGLCETCWALIGKSNTSEEGRKLSKEILQHINDKIHLWAEEDGLNYSLYGTPEENLTGSAAAALKRDFGEIEHITDKDYVVNSYHVDPREEINAFSKLRIEGEYLDLCSGGAVSYIETTDLRNNPKAIENVMQFMYDNIAYAEFNRIMGKCYTCGFEGVIPLLKTESGKFQFKCPKCGETHDENLNVVGRICGYLGQINAGNTGHGRLSDIYHRVVHLG